MILLETNPALKNLLFDFKQPGKIDLEAYTTDRSLATFKRDFEKIYNTSPSRWIQQKDSTMHTILLRKEAGNHPTFIWKLVLKTLAIFLLPLKKLTA
jgi:hypothetical protein